MAEQAVSVPVGPGERGRDDGDGDYDILAEKQVKRYTRQWRTHLLDLVFGGSSSICK